MVASVAEGRDALSERHGASDFDADDSKVAATKLFDLVAEKDDKGAIEQAKNTPREARTWIVRKESPHLISWKRLPIHEACIRQPSAGLIAALLEAYPDGASEPDHNGRLPLHHACFYGASREVVDQLIMSYPRAIDVKDVWEKTPLHVAQGSTSRDRRSIVEALSKGYAFYEIKKQEEKWESAVQKRFNSWVVEAEARFEDEKTKLETESLKAKQWLEDDLDRTKRLHALELEQTKSLHASELERVKNELQLELERSKDLEKDLEATQMACEEHVSAIGRLEQENAEEREKKASLNHALTCSKEGLVQIPALEERVQELEKTNDALVHDLEDKSEAVESYQHRLDNAVDRQIKSEANAKQLAEKLRMADEAVEELEKQSEAEKEEIASFHQKLSESLAREHELLVELDRMNNQVKEMEREIKDLKKVVSVKEALEAQVKDLSARLEETEEAHKNSVGAMAEQKRVLESEIDAMQSRIEKLNDTVDGLEKKAEEDAATIASIGKSAADAYLHSSECISQFEQKLEEVTERSTEQEEAYRNEKEALSVKVFSLENTVRTLITKRGEEQRQAMESFNELERALNHAADERNRMLETLVKQKQAIKGDDDPAARERVLQLKNWAISGGPSVSSIP